MANVFASNLGEYSSFGQLFGNGGGGASISSSYASFWPNGNGRTLLIDANALTAFIQVVPQSEYYGHQVYASGGSDETSVVEIWEDATVHLQLTWLSTGHLRIKRGNGGTILATSTTTYSRNLVLDVQWRAVIHDSTGVFQLRINGNPGFDINFSGDTRNGGTSGVINRIAWRQLGGTVTILASDFVINDTTGSFESGWTGAVRVVLGTVSANGASGVQFTPNTGSNFQCVDDTIPGFHDGDTTYNQAEIPGHTDWFVPASTMFSGMTLDTIKFIRLKYTVRASDGGSHTSRSKVKTSGTVADGASVTMSSAYTQKEDTYYVNPNTSTAWASFAEITGSEFGYEMVT